MLSATKYKSLCNSENQKDAKCLMKMNDCIIKKNSFKIIICMMIFDQESMLKVEMKGKPTEY